MSFTWLESPSILASDLAHLQLSLEKNVSDFPVFLEEEEGKEEEGVDEEVAEEEEEEVDICNSH